MTPAELFEQTIRADGRYPIEAYEFLHSGLDVAMRRVHGEEPGEGPHHVSGRELCLALRDLALARWGPLAPVVLQRWGIHRTRDFGEMVFLLVGAGLLGRQESDRIEDFDDVYDFQKAFSAYEIPLDAAAE